jgi:hypothetical protein
MPYKVVRIKGSVMTVTRSGCNQKFIRLQKAPTINTCQLRHRAVDDLNTGPRDAEQPDQNPDQDPNP